MRKYSLDKLKCVIFAVCILLILLSWIIFSLLTSSKKIQALILGAVILWPFVIILVQFIQSRKNYIIVTDEYIVFKERGVREQKVLWENIERIQLRGIRLLPISNTMVIHFNNTVTSLNNSYITVDYFYEDYNELWKEIINKYKSQVGQHNVDHSFNKYLD